MLLRSLVLLCGAALLCCGGEGAPRATAAPSVAAPPETTSLVYLLRMDAPAGTTAHSAMSALRAALAAAGYRVVLDPAAAHDAQILCRASVYEEAFGFGATDYTRRDHTERVALHATVVARGRVVDEAGVEFISANLQISALHVQPLVERLSSSAGLSQLGAAIRDERAAPAPPPPLAAPEGDASP